MHPYLKGKRFIGIIAAVILLVFAVPYILDAFKPGDKWSLSEDGLVSYPLNRGALEYTKIILNDTPDFTLSKIVYKSKGEDIYSLLRVAKSSGKKPALILLPGAQVTKEAMQDRAAKLSGWGYITLTIDERGNTGETKGGFSSMDEEYTMFIQNQEPVQHKIVFDVLRAFDFLAEQKDVDAANIAVLGESMGGRYGIMAAAIEPRIKGVAGVSTAGYDSLSKQFQDENVARFFKSIDPDAYTGKIAPRQLLMIHSTNDSVIPISMAQASFAYASESKKFVTVTCKTHGWCDEMEPALKEKLEIIFKS